jgi:hypothetical protein
MTEKDLTVYPKKLPAQTDEPEHVCTCDHCDGHSCACHDGDNPKKETP